MRAAFIAGFAMQSLVSFFCDDVNHDEGRDWVGPPQPEPARVNAF
jgi:hypothetical protein